ncbi:hypothetical protein SAY87_017849 [Trapa incisa]|uniref:Protein kinase domain-containing protein n=1 Tax=Trapa incisa TaxID=236973 RepID=A0AAN7QTA0_9MYRT|nr:hypothetical protein SAY87_017849 [Trapa incisa]
MATTTSNSLPWIRGRVIGRGSYGSVCLAFDRASARIFAVKSVDLSSHPDQIDSLDNEIGILSSLDHCPYIVEYLGHDSDGLHRNLHLELLPGGTVTDAAARRRLAKFPDEETVRSHTRCLVSALSHLHSRDIVHCDVKGRNVIVGQDPRTAKLADFGSAMRVGSVNRPRGSPLWMAPEAIRGEYQGPESDVWALGCTVIEMVTGRPAWEDEGAETVRRIGFSDELPEFPMGMSAQGLDFLEKCLRKDRKERWSCDQLSQHPFLSSETITESSPRCVLDWVNCEFDEDLESEDDDDSDELKTEMESSTEAELEVCSTSSRVGELCHGGGAGDWESEDDWVVVRRPGTETPAPGGELKRREAGASLKNCGKSVGERANEWKWPEYLEGGWESKWLVDEVAVAMWALVIYSYSIGNVVSVIVLPCIMMLAIFGCNRAERTNDK